MLWLAEPTVLKVMAVFDETGFVVADEPAGMARTRLTRCCLLVFLLF